MDLLLRNRHVVEQRLAGHALVRVGVVRRDDALVAPPDVPGRPVEVACRQLARTRRAESSRRPARCETARSRPRRRSSPRRTRLDRDSREAPYRLLVDPVAGEDLELLREQVARRLRAPGWSGRDVAPVDGHRRRLVRAVVLERQLPAEPPAASRPGAAPRPSGPHAAASRARRSRARAPASARATARAGPRRCRTRRSSRTARAAARGPGSGSSHSAESTISRSATPRSCSSSVEPKGRSPRQRRNAGRSVTRSGETTLAGACARGPQSVMLDHLEADRAAAGREAAQVDVGVERVAIVVRIRDGAGSSARDAARRGRRAFAPRPRATAPAPRPCAS